jgi:hypothetical protein
MRPGRNVGTVGTIVRGRIQLFIFDMIGDRKPMPYE